MTTELDQLKKENEELKEKLKKYEIQVDFDKSQKEQNKFLIEQLHCVFNRLLESDIRVIREMNKAECKNIKINKCEMDENCHFDKIKELTKEM